MARRDVWHSPSRETLSNGVQSRLERLNVRRLPTLGSLHHVELHCLAFLQALEAGRVDRRVVHEHVLTVLTANETKPLGIVEPLHCSLFHVCYFLSAKNLPLDPNRGST